jgi:hypothetical protein
MAKQKSKLLRVAALSDFIQVTADNRKIAIVAGRMLYVISRNTDGQYITVMNRFPIRLRMVKGMLITDGEENKVWTDETPAEYAGAFKAIIDMEIKAKRLYIKKNEALIKYQYK